MKDKESLQKIIDLRHQIDVGRIDGRDAIMDAISAYMVDDMATDHDRNNVVDLVDDLVLEKKLDAFDAVQNIVVSLAMNIADASVASNIAEYLTYHVLSFDAEKRQMPCAATQVICHLFQGLSRSAGPKGQKDFYSSKVTELADILSFNMRDIPENEPLLEKIAAFTTVGKRAAPYKVDLNSAPKYLN